MSFKENNDDLRRMIILDHYENPKYFTSNDKAIDKTYCSFNNNSPSCIDNITAYVKLTNNKVKDVKLVGEACAIATSSTDLMASMVVNKSKTEAIKIINNYLSMIDNKKFDKTKIKDLYVFDNVNKQINRINCAKVGILAIKNAIEHGKK